MTEAELFYKFTWPGKTSTSGQDALDLIYSSPIVSDTIAFARDKDGWTLTHHACYKGWFDVVRVLIQEYKADPHSLNNFLCTPLHWAAFGGHLSIVRYLISEHSCDPAVRNKRGNTPLQIACWRGNLEVVKFLVSECKCDPLKPNNNNITPFDESLVCGHIHIVSFFLSTGLTDKLIERNNVEIPKLLSDWYYRLFKTIIGYRKHNPLKPTLKVFVLGDSEVGKTTLVRALEMKLRGSKLSMLGGKYRHVPAVAPHTAGMSTTHIDSSASGSIMLFDFAGHQEFYCSHAALLENVDSSHGSVLLILLDLTKSKSELNISLQSWMSFLDSIYSAENRPPSLIIGSHSDILKHRGDNPSDKLHSVCSSSGLTTWDIKATQLVMNCTKVSSSALNTLTHHLQQHFCTYQSTFNMDTKTHVINAVIKHYFKNSAACQVGELVTVLEQQNEGLFQYNLLPNVSDDHALSQHIQSLSDLGEIVYLKSESFKDGWIVFDKHLLFSEINGTVFSSLNFPSKYIHNSTGIVSKTSIQKVFNNHNIDMITKFLVYFKYCYKIPRTPCIETEQYFFPHLVNSQKNHDNVYFSDHSAYTCKWQLKCKKCYQFFTTRFAQSLIVQLATLFGLTLQDCDESENFPVMLKECNVWNLGVHWKSMDGVEVVVEFDDSYKTVLLQMGCSEGDELELVKLRSKIIKLVLQIKNYCSKDIETIETFTHPTNLVTDHQPLCSPYQYSKDRIYMAAINRNKYVTSKVGADIKHVAVKQLLYVEPLHLIPSHVLRKIFGTVDTNALLNPDLLEELQSISKEDHSGLLTMLLKSISVKDLKESIESHSIFCEVKL